MKRDSSETGLKRRKRTLSPCVQTTPAHVTENKVLMIVLRYALIILYDLYDIMASGTVVMHFILFRLQSTLSSVPRNLE